MRIAAAAAVVAAFAFGAVSAPAADPRYEDPAYCSQALGMSTPLADGLHRRCMIAIAGAYLDAETNPALAAKLPIAEDATRHLLGRADSHGALGKAGILAALDQSTVASIKNRQWSVEGDVAYVVYDAALRTDPKPTPYSFGERITIDKGMIKDVILLAPSGVQ
ncbi:MAG TPA: hypothetical protein VKZ79_19710 [Alphaproteobacteria bacterium]|nr:hypothetical protein [Alphaproteobacteria bacterium]